MRLEDLRPDAVVRGILPDAGITVVSAEWHGADALTLVYRAPDGKVADEILYRSDESRLADEVIAHLAGQVGADVTVRLEIEASLPNGATDQLVRIVTENGRTLRFENHGFEKE